MKLTDQQIERLRFLLREELTGMPITVDTIHHALVRANEKMPLRHMTKSK